jgi:hypothetical protein
MTPYTKLSSWFILTCSVIGMLAATCLNATSGSMPYTLSVLDSHNTTKTILFDDHCLVFAMATWCPHSKELKELINNPHVKANLDKVRIIFIFGNNEWPEVEAELNQMVQDGDMSQQQAEQKLLQLKKRAGGSNLFNPLFLLDLGHEFYRLPPNSPVQIPSVPTLYSTTKGKFGGWTPEVFLQFCTAEDINAAISEVYKQTAQQ